MAGGDVTDGVFSSCVEGLDEPDMSLSCLVERTDKALFSWPSMTPAKEASRSARA